MVLTNSIAGHLADLFLFYLISGISLRQVYISPPMYTPNIVMLLLSGSYSMTSIVL